MESGKGIIGIIIITDMLVFLLLLLFFFNPGTQFPGNEKIIIIIFLIFTLLSYHCHILIVYCVCAASLTK